MPDSGDRGELLASFASRTLGCRNRAIALATPVNDRNLVLHDNLDKCAIYAAFRKATNSVLVAAKRCAFSSR